MEGVALEILISLAIFSARIADVSLDTLRLFAVVHGRRGRAWCLAFVQVLIWLTAVASVVTHIWDKPWYAVAYALGFATGNYVGISLEGWMAHGEQVVRVFSRRGPEIAAILRGEGYGVTEFDGRGKDGHVTMLFIETRRKTAMDVARRARELDPGCYLIIDDIRATSSRGMRGVGPRVITAVPGVAVPGAAALASEQTPPPAQG
jgi:uncharacterized protein YebE (UPF0316 family)